MNKGRNFNFSLLSKGLILSNKLLGLTLLNALELINILKPIFKYYDLNSFRIWTLTMASLMIARIDRRQIETMHLGRTRDNSIHPQVIRRATTMVRVRTVRWAATQCCRE